MSNYQPSQTLSWRYSAGTGQLSIVSKITVEVGANEYISLSVSSIRSDTVIITMTLGPAPSSSLTVYISLEMIGAGLNKDQVRGIIRTIVAKTVITTFYKDNKIEGEVINSTSQNSEIEMI
jgi:hypothetical protein